MNKFHDYCAEKTIIKMFLFLALHEKKINEWRKGEAGMLVTQK